MSGHDLSGFGFKFLDRLKERHLFRIAAAYLGLAWLVVHVATVFGETFPPIHHAMPWLIYALGAGFPIVLVGSWFAHHRPNIPSFRNIGARRLDAIILGLMVIAACALLVDRWLLHRESSESML